FAFWCWGRFLAPAISSVYRARMIFDRLTCVHARGSGCLKFLFSGSGRSTLRTASIERLAISPRGIIALPGETCIVADEAISTQEAPNTRSEISGEVSAASM